MGTENHKVPVIRITEMFKHPNADSLSIVKIGGYQVVVRTTDFKIGDMAYYIPPDSVVPEIGDFAFLWADKEFPVGQVPVKYRRVTVRRFRKEMSEGMLMPLIGPPWVELWDIIPTEGMNVAEVLGITHYEPPEDPASTKGENETGPSKRQGKFWPRSLKGWLYFLPRVLTFGLIDFNGRTGGTNMKPPENVRPVYDVESFKHFPDEFQCGESVVLTEKIHGSNARYTFDEGKMFCGSRNLWKSASSNCIWRKGLKQHPWIEEWCRAHKGHTLYGEIVPTQKGYHYGCKNGDTKFFPFDVRTPEGKWVGWSDLAKYELPADKWVPVLDQRMWSRETVLKLVDGPSTVPDANHIREGIVVRPVIEREACHLGRVQLKIVSNAFLLEDSK